MCPYYSDTPCITSAYMGYGEFYKIQIGNANKNVCYILYKKYIGDIFGQLSKGECIRLPICTEKKINLKFPNKDKSLLTEFKKVLDTSEAS